jgi:SAM-dependent methyltransferase
LFLKLAEQRGAVIAGLDAAASLIEIARERSPAADLVVGEMEQLPFAARSFDVVTGFNAYEFAANPDRALAEAARVGIPAAAVVIATWGQREQCEAAAYVTELGALLAPRQGAQRPFAVSETNAMEWFATRAGLTVGPHREVLCVWHYPDTAALLRAFASTGFAVQAIKTVGEEAVTRAILNAVAPFRLSDGGYRLENVFGYVIAHTQPTERTRNASAG